MTSYFFNPNPSIALWKAVNVKRYVARIMIDDRLLGIGVKEAQMEILGGMMPQDNTYRQQNLEKVYQLGRNL